MDISRVNEYWQAATGTIHRLRSGLPSVGRPASSRPAAGRPAAGRSRGRTNRLRRFGPHTAMIRQRLADLDSIRQAALSRR